MVNTLVEPSVKPVWFALSGSKRYIGGLEEDFHFITVYWTSQLKLNIPFLANEATNLNRDSIVVPLSSSFFKTRFRSKCIIFRFMDKVTQKEKTNKLSKSTRVRLGALDFNGANILIRVGLCLPIDPSPRPLPPGRGTHCSYLLPLYFFPCGFSGTNILIQMKRKVVHYKSVRKSCTHDTRKKKKSFNRGSSIYHLLFAFASGISAMS